MLRNIKTFHKDALMDSEAFRSYVESFESELLRGISTLIILSIIKEHSKEGIYGYQILKDIEEKTNNVLIIDEGTLYPMLRKLEKDNILSSKISSSSGRRRKYYLLTEIGKNTFDHLEGFFSKLLEAISPLLSFKITLDRADFIYCPNCANKINIKDEVNFCRICGLNVKTIINED